MGRRKLKAMKIIEPSYTILRPCALDAVARKDALHTIADAARTCYKSTGTDDATLVMQLVRSGHEAMLEHYGLTVRFVVDRGVSHEIVRHRIASYAQESTRYCSYDKAKFGQEITVVVPPNLTEEQLTTWTSACIDAESKYFKLLREGCTAEIARGVLPTSLKTEIVVTMNLREWRHFFKLRALGVTGRPHPQIKQVAYPLMVDFAMWLPEVFGDLIPDNQEKGDNK